MKKLLKFKKFLVRNFQSCDEFGQTLLEVVIALATGVVVISAMAVIVLSSLNNAQFSKNQNQATQYAQEGIEYLKNISETDWTTFSTIPAGDYCLSPLTSKVPGDPNRKIAQAGKEKVSLLTDLASLLPKFGTKVNVVQKASAIAPIRFYLPSSGDPVPAITPGYDAGWEDTTLAIAATRLRTSTTKTGTAMTTIPFNDNSSSNKDILFRQYISDPINAVSIITPTVKFQIRGSETNTSNNMYTTLAIRVVSSDGTVVRGTVLPVTRDNTELSTSLRNRQFTATSATTVNAQTGDRLVIEIGTAGTPTDEHDSSLHTGDFVATDLPQDDLETNDYSPWVELSTDISFAPTPTPTVTPTPTIAPIRYYLPSSGAPQPALSPAYDAGWEDTTFATARLRTHTTKTNTTMTSLTFSDSDLSNRDILFRQYISDPMQAVDIINPTIKFQIRASEETGTGQDMYTSLHVRVVQPDGSLRGIILPVTRDNVELALNTPTNRQFATTSAVTVNVQDGDRLVFEIGTGGDPTIYGHDSEVRIGDLTSLSDLLENDTTTTDLVPWVEFNASSFVPPAIYAISGDVFVDDGIGGGTANNGVKDGTEANYPGATVTRTGTGTTVAVSGAGSPGYAFSGLSGGSYDLTLTIPSGYLLSNGGANPNFNPRTVVVSGADAVNNNFGIVVAPTSTPTPTPTLTPTPGPTSTPTPSPTPSATPIPTPTPTPIPTPTPTLGPYGDVLIPGVTLPLGCGQNVDNFSRKVTIDQFAAGDTTSLGSSDCLPTNVARAKVTVSVGWSDNKCTNPSDPYCHKIKLISCVYNTPTISPP